MLSYDRHQKILEILNEQPSADVRYLCDKAYASPATIRRDLREMSRQGLIKRVYGGAVLNDGGNHEPPLAMRQLSQTADKIKIAQIAATFLKKGQTVFLDSSSTATYLAKEIIKTKDEYSVLSNGINAINILNSSREIRLYTCGGTVKNNASVVGSIAKETINRFHADILFLSCAGLSKFGATEGSEEGADIKRAMLENSSFKILLCDSSKFYKDFFCKTCGLNQIDVFISDKPLPDEFLPLNNKKIQIITVK
ncbi:MAG: DeoR/GlpR family DNA-binding transcription regulator [Oscillospiraceae bacterium]